MLVVTLALMLQASAVDTPCQKLTRSFAENEVAFTVVDDLNRASLEASRKFADATGDYSGVTRQSALREGSIQKFKAEGDRIIVLMTGNGCALPDHVASPSTFRADLAACVAAKGTSQEEAACSYIERAVGRMGGKPSPAATPKKRKQR